MLEFTQSIPLADVDWAANEPKIPLTFNAYGVLKEDEKMYTPELAQAPLLCQYDSGE